MKNGLACRVIVFAWSLTLGGVGWAAQAYAETQISDPLVGELQYLLGFVGAGRQDPSTLQPGRIAGLFAFIEGEKARERLYHAGSPQGVASAYYEVDMRSDWEHVLRLTYNPDIPAVLTGPSTLNFARWVRVDRADRQIPRLWEWPAKPVAPLFFTGVEHLANTPDQTTGAYYDYDLYRTIILTSIRGRRLLLSLSKQTGVSSVGKKGLIVGPDSHWDYVYTGEQGLNRFGIGWAKTYMYGSYSVAFYLESANAAKPGVRFAVFKWLAAGWSGLNLVKAAHIHAGLERYALTYKTLLEHPALKDSQTVEKHLAGIHALSAERLRAAAGIYVAWLGRQARSEGLLSRDEALDWFDKGHYLKGLQREEMESILIREYLKRLVGKPYQVDLLQLLAQR